MGGGVAGRGLSPRSAILLSTSLDLVSFGMAIPVLSFLMSGLGASPKQQGLIASAYSALQFFSCPLLGRLSDRVGRVPLLLVSAAANGVGLLGMAWAPTLGWYAAFRLLPGVLKCNLTVGQAYVADITDHGGRTAGMGVLGVALGLGFVVGPAIGGALSSYGYSAPLQAGALLCVGNLAFIALAVQETAGPRADPGARPAGAVAEGGAGEGGGKAESRAAILGRPATRTLLHHRLAFALAFSLWQFHFPIHARALGMDSKAVGLQLGFIGLLAALTNGVLVQAAVRRWGERPLVQPIAATMGLALGGWAVWAPSPWGRAVVLVPLATAGAAFTTVTSSLLSKTVPPESVGGLLGVAGSVDTVARTVSPLLGGWLAERFGDAAVEAAGAGLCGYLAACLAAGRRAARPKGG